jgi:lysophospholipase L1-like esterase
MIKKSLCILLSLLLCIPAIPQSVLPNHPWQHKRVAYIGDSITDPKNKTTDVRYWNFLQQWLDITPYVYAVSGRQWNDVIHQANQLKSLHGNDFDAIMIFMGTNDFNAAVPLGKWYNETKENVLAAVHKPKAIVKRMRRTPCMDPETFRGRINIALDSLKRMFPDKQIVLLTPIHRANARFSDNNIQPSEQYQNECGEYFTSYVEAVKEAGSIWSVPVIDLYSTCGLMPVLDKYVPYFGNYETDRLHPNRIGHLRIAKTLYYQLATLPCTFDE